MKILHYTQYVMGIGHLFRSMAIDRALAPQTVDFITGGSEVPVPMPDNVRHHVMPALMMDTEYTVMLKGDDERNLESIWAERRAILLDLFRELEPDVILIEMFPFGRRRFARELLPMLKANLERRRPAAVLCSVRDILVEKSEQDLFERRVLGWLNPYFNGVLVHSDPGLIRFEQTFSRVRDIACPLWYTGYVAQGPTLPDRHSARAALELDQEACIVLASAGSGPLGRDMLGPVLEASILLHRTLPHQLLMFTGPRAERADLEALQARAREHPAAVIRDFTPRFPDHVLACDLSVSRGGYNTTMNLLTCGTRGLMLPNDHDREQRMRLAALVAGGHLGLLEPGDMEPARLAGIMERALKQEQGTGRPLRLDGARESADIILRLARERMDGAAPATPRTSEHA